MITGLGSLGGTDFDAALGFALEQPQPWFPELPNRGPAASMIARATAVLDLPWAGQRAARALLADDLDRLAEVADGYVGPLRVPICGPWTLVANLELPRGQQVLSDPGAVREVQAALAEGVDDLRRRVLVQLPGVKIITQCDEPSLPAVLAGKIPNSSGLFCYPAVAKERAAEVLGSVAGSDSVLHCCAPGLDWSVVATADFAALSVPLSLTDPDSLSAWLAEGRGLYLGILAGDAAEWPTAAESSRAVLRLFERAGGVPDPVVLTPECGIPALTLTAAAQLFRRLREVDEAVAEALA